VTDVSVSGPNFNGTRVVTGMKYKDASLARTSVFFPIEALLFLIPAA
jgi:hypothetical protein